MKKIFYVIPLCVLLLAGCGAKNTGPADQSKNGAKENQRQESADTETSMKASLRSLLGGNKAVVCNYEESTVDADSKIKLYLDPVSKKMRTEGEIFDKKEKKNMKMWSIADGQNNYYAWNDLMVGQGFKMSLDEAKEDDAPAKDDEGRINLDEEKDIRCRTWKVDNSLFELPKDVTFSDLTATLKNIQTQTQTQNQTQVQGQVPSANQGICGACNMVSDPAAKAQCLEAGACNK